MCGYTFFLLFLFFFLSVVEFLKQVAACPGCTGTEDLEEDLNVDDDDPGQHGSPVSSVHSPRARPRRTCVATATTAAAAPPPSAATTPAASPGPSPSPLAQTPHESEWGGGDRSVMFGYEMADLRELTLEDLMALRTKCGRWLKHIELQNEERR